VCSARLRSCESHARSQAREQWEIDRAALEIHNDACLGRGSFGEVHRGSWRGTEVAVKRLREDIASDRELLEFRRELAIVNHLAHPNIVQFLGACTTSMPLCIVTEYMPGGNLADLLVARGEERPFPLGRVLNWALDTAKGMRYLHERRPTMIIHRDLKPEKCASTMRVAPCAPPLTQALPACCWTRLGASRSPTLGSQRCVRYGP